MVNQPLVFLIQPRGACLHAPLPNIPLTGLSNSHIGSPIATPLETTDYEVLVTDQFGCQNTDTVRVTVEEDFKIVASNVFTPDDNGQNDTWVISNVETFGDVNVRVFDRYGTVVFQETAYENTWRGRLGGAPVATIYFLTAPTST